MSHRKWIDRKTWRIVLFLLIGIGGGWNLPLFAEDQIVLHRIYTHRLEPREHPDYSRRYVQPPDWDTFGNQTRFACLRGFDVQNDQIVNYTQALDQYTLTHRLGEVIWPAYPILFAKNLGDLAEEIQRRNLFLFDIWGYVPGSGPGGYWQQYKPPAGVFDLLESKLGERWLGMDVGEQDGRYIGGYANQMRDPSVDRFHQYLNFQHHFQRMCDDLGNRMATLVSLNFGHYFLKEGVYTLIGAETAQALPNSQVYYSFIRGAGKQYGVPWFGNASVYNRWGYKSYAGEGEDHSPTKGTSLSLFKRLLYNHILYNSVFVGFESGWFDSQNNLSPIGRIQKSAKQWIEENGQPGEMIAPIALMVDFYSGWSFPRHLYTGDVYRVWGNLPYAQGDYLTDGVLDMFYPGYQDSSYFHDETGFLTATPYGDSVDCLLSDAPSWVLNRYAVLIMAGEIQGGWEIHDKLENYVKQGGHLILTAGNLATLPEGLAGIRVAGEPHILPPCKIHGNGTSWNEPSSFSLTPLRFPASASVIAHCAGEPAAVEIGLGSGTLTVLASPFGIAEQPVNSEPVKNLEDRSLTKPYPLLSHVRAILDPIFASRKLFDVGDGLDWITCRKKSGEYIVGVCNNFWEERPLRIVSHCGAIDSIQELPLDSAEKTAVGYVPEKVSATHLGENRDNTISGGDMRIFRVQVQEQFVEEIPHAAPPARPQGRILPLFDIPSIQNAVLSRPTLFESYDGVLVDWNYLRIRDEEAIRKETGWIERQKLRVIVDLSSGINLYPDLRLVDNDEEEYATSMKTVESLLDKMEILHSHDLVISLHRTPENNFTDEQTWNALDRSVKQICHLAAEKSIAIHIRMTPGKPPWNLKNAAQFVDRIEAPNLHLAVSTALILSQHVGEEEIMASLKNRIGLWMIGMPAYDVGGRLWSVNAPIMNHADRSRLREILALFPDAPMVFDVHYASVDDEYLDVRSINRIP